MLQNSRTLPNGDFEVVYTKEYPRVGKVEVLRDGKWYTLLPYEPYHIDPTVPPRSAAQAQTA